MARGMSSPTGLEKNVRSAPGPFKWTEKGLKFFLRTPEGEGCAVSPDRRVHVYNILAAVGAGLALNLPLEAVVRGIEALQSIPGRLERVENEEGWTLVVELFHKPDALLKAMTSLKPYVKGRLITVFGCGGTGTGQTIRHGPPCRRAQ